MDYVQTPPAERQQMLEAIGVDHADDLFANLPEAFRLKHPLALAGLPESGVKEEKYVYPVRYRVAPDIDEGIVPLPEDAEQDTGRETELASH